MNKHFALMAIIAMVGVVSCNKNPKPEPTPKPEPEPDPVTATITAGDVTVDEGKTVSINASTNSTATITYATADAAVATVDANGTVTGVKAGNTKITLKVAAVDKKFTAAEKTINVTVNAVEVPPAELKSIEIDGQFEDWAALDKGTFSQTYGDEESLHPALIAAKVYAVADYIYVYFEWDPDMVAPEFDVDHVPFHCYINTDGDASTGGFGEFADLCTDVLLEGSLYGGDDASSFGLTSYSPSAFVYAGAPNTDEWAWDPLAIEEEICQGAGIEGKYEFLIKRAPFATVGFPIADQFSIGFDIQKNWDSVGVLPSAAPSEDNTSGVLPSLPVITQK
ncbi:MAG: Ig-like domain-containing protein [Bacteroidales bacterium]|nr:Ig-like domain-containing protein [Bacteroidales bacterium]